ncbi:hypothetical protein [Chryseobacterium wanjuense]
MAHQNFKKKILYKILPVNIKWSFVKEILAKVPTSLLKEKEDGDYEVLSAEIKRHNKSIFICWSEPFDGRVIFDE